MNNLCKIIIAIQDNCLNERNAFYELFLNETVQIFHQGQGRHRYESKI